MILFEFLIVEFLEIFLVEFKGGVVVIGNFDGVYCGYCVVLDVVFGLGYGMYYLVFVMSFELYFCIVFNLFKLVFWLILLFLKIEMLGVCGLDGVLILLFIWEFVVIEVNVFVQDILIDMFGILYVVIGYDFYFGCGCEGILDYLCLVGVIYGFGVMIVQCEEDENVDVIFLLWIWDCFGIGDLLQVNGFLGYWWFFDVIVCYGDKCGWDLGYLIVNFQIVEDCLLLYGIYVVKVKLVIGWYDGVVSYGWWLIFDNGVFLFEVYLFDFKGDFYGQFLWVYVLFYLCGEQKFELVDVLIVQMDWDSEEVRVVIVFL